MTPLLSPLVRELPAIDKARLERLARELRVMLGDMPAERVRELAFELVKDLGRTTSRRVALTAGLFSRWTRSIADQAVAAAAAAREGRLVPHLDDRRQAVSSAAHDIADRVATSIGRLQQSLKADPAETLVNAFTSSMTALIASSRDEVAPPAPRRSDLLHPLLIGAAAETVCLSIIRTINTSHRYLPHGHDPFWDAAAQRCRPFADTGDHGFDSVLAHRLLHS
ncbi:hypothetical protein BH09PSE6_BH09PSE6_31510 [soil metagenome]